MAVSTPDVTAEARASSKGAARRRRSLIEFQFLPGIPVESSPLRRGW
jgi:hypothetical protein